MIARLRLSLARLRGRGGRAVVAGLGIAAAGAMLGTAVTVSYSLGTGFDRAAERADLPDVVVRFDSRRARGVRERLDALANVADAQLRFEVTRIDMGVPGERTGEGVVQVIEPGRRGYAVLEGRDLADGRDEVLIEQGLAREWKLGVGDSIAIGGLGAMRIAGITLSPDNVAYPLARTARVYVTRAEIERRFGPNGPPRTNLALLWARNPDRLDELLVQARGQAYGLRQLRFVTQNGVRVLIDQAAGIVIALLVAFSIVTLAAAGAMLAAASSGDVQRRLPSIGVMRALGLSRREVTAQHALDALVLAVPAGLVGLALGALAARGPTERLLLSLNELPAGAGLVALLGGTLVALCLLVTLSTALPAWRAAGRSPAELLRGGDLEPRPGAGRSIRGGGFTALGARLVLARRGRLAATVVVLAAAIAVVLLMLGLADSLDRLRNDPAVLGKRYSLTVDQPAEFAGDVARVRGVEAAAGRYQFQAADSFSLGETITVIGYDGDPSRFEAPPLADGRRARGPDEVEVGRGLADVLGLEPGGTLALQMPSGAEVRLRVTGIVRALQSEGRVAYARSDRLLAADPGLRPQIAVRLEPGADPLQVRRDLAAAGLPATTVRGATTGNAQFLGVLATVLRVIAVINALVCLYALVQALALVARERQNVVSVLRASGAGLGSIARVFAGAALLTALLALPLAIVLEVVVLAPWVERTAAGYGDLPIVTDAAAAIGVGAGLVAIALLAAVVTAARMLRRPVVAGLREEPA